MSAREICRVVLMTARNEEEAEELARVLVKERLAACVNIVPGIRSFFWWEGKIEEQSEVLLLVKTTEPLLRALKNTVQAQHSYQVPEIIALPIVEGSEEYLDWLMGEVQTN